MESIAVFWVLLFLVAFLYASVGHGGASGYLALMALFNFAPDIMKPTALLLNVFVSFVSFIQFYRAGHFNWRLFLPFALASIPFSFLGGLVVVDGSLYKRILGLFLLVPIARFLFFKNADDKAENTPNIILSLLIGSAIGFLSGLIGIGGGILLSPIVVLLHWANQKQAAAISALFIFVNSLAGLTGQIIKGINFSTHMYLLVAVAFVGGIGGAYIGATHFRQSGVRNILAIVLLVAAYKLLFTTA